MPTAFHRPRGRLAATMSALLAALSASLLIAACGGNDDPPVTEVATTLGTVRGSEDTTAGTLSWKGLPFAKAPVGTLRWRAPADPDAWSTPRDATAFGAACVQIGRIYGPGSNNRYDATIGTTIGQAVGSEDCLYLNVWRPRDGAAGRPVIVFVHGGSNVSGYTADPVYDGAALARAANAVVVTVNYRVGVFGFLNVPALRTGTASEDAGNFALLDIVKALQFVNANAAVFGGDPGNVTLMGQSAGAINVYALMTMPSVVAASPKLFHRAVPLSGGISLATNLPAGSLPTLNPASSALAQGTALLQQQVIADGLATDATTAQAYIAGRTNAQLADYLRSKSASTVLATVGTRLAPLGLSGSGPIPDGSLLPADPIGAIAAGRYLKVPVLAGTTRDEGKLFPTFLALSPALGGVSGRLVTDAQLFANHLGYQPDAPAQTAIGQWIPAAYLPAATPTTGFTARTRLLGDIFLGVARDNALNTLKAQQAEVWYYRFDWDEEPAPWNEIYGAAHAFDLPFLFGNFGASLFANVANSTANRGGRLALSESMMQSLASFARTGNPNNASLGVTWPAWPAQLLFDASATAKVVTVQ